MKHRVNQWMKRVGQDFSEDCDWGREALSLLPRIEEEVDEMRDAVETGDIVEYVDAVADLEYFLSQCILLLEKKGVDYEQVKQRVCDNNDDKYSTSKTYVENWLTEWAENDPWFALKLHIEETYIPHEGETYYCLKDESGKVRKPKSHEPINLLPCIPTELLVSL